jgi:hypothetical protein
MGLGFGLAGVCGIILIQESVIASERGSATASNIFARNLGSTLGAAVFGAVQTFVFNRYPGVVGQQIDKLRDLLTGGSTHIAADDVVRRALEKSLDTTFVFIFAVSLLVLVSMFLLPKIELAGVTGDRASPEAR